MSRSDRIYDALFTALSPDKLIVEDESSQHQVPKNAETHFKLIIVSDVFEGKPRVRRHQHVYDLLADELSSGLHALSMHLYTPQEYAKQGAPNPASPVCVRAARVSKRV